MLVKSVPDIGSLADGWMITKYPVHQESLLADKPSGDTTNQQYASCFFIPDCMTTRACDNVFGIDAK